MSDANNAILLQSVQTNDCNQVAFLLSNGGADPTACLLTAASLGLADMVNTLLIYHADVHVSSNDANGHTALHFAAINNYLDVAAVLLHHAADPNMYSNNRNPRIVKVAAKPVDDKTRGAAAKKKKKKKKGEPPPAAHIVEVRLKPNACTPLHEAAIRGHREMVNLLLNAGADPHLVDGHGFTAQLLASKAGHHTTASLLPVERPAGDAWTQFTQQIDYEQRCRELKEQLKKKKKPKPKKN